MKDIPSVPAKSKINEFKKKISTFHQTANITKHDIPGECSFTADPFIYFDASSSLWHLFVETAFPGRRQFIGALTSPDLHNWVYKTDVLKGSRESFPCITQIGTHFLLMPCIDASPAPGLVTFYKANTLSGPWTLEYQINLKKRVNDRVLLPGIKDKCYYLVYGTKTKIGQKLEYVEIELDKKPGKIILGEKKVLAYQRLDQFIRSKIFKNPRLIMRPGGSLVPFNDGYILPIQGTRTGKYGECLAFSFIALRNNGIEFKAYDFIRPTDFFQGWTSCHHFSFFRKNSCEVFAVDGHSDSAPWEVRIFSNNCS